MRHYCFLVSKYQAVSVADLDVDAPQMGRQSWANHYTLSVEDDDKTFNLTETVNWLTLAEMFMHAQSVVIDKVIVLEYAGELFSSKTRTHLFVQNFRYNFGYAPKPDPTTRGLVREANRGGRFFGVQVTTNRVEGKGTRRFYGTCLGAHDLAAFKRQKRYERVPVLYRNGPMTRFWFAWHVAALRRAGAFDEVLDVRRDGSAVPYFAKADSEPLVATPSVLADDARKNARRSQPELAAMVIIDRAIHDVAQSLFEYESAMTTFDHRWGDGSVPSEVNRDVRDGDGLPVQHYSIWVSQFHNACGIWYVLAKMLNFSIPEPLGRDTGMVRGKPHYVPSVYDGFIELSRNEAQVQELIQRLCQLDKFFKEHLSAQMAARFGAIGKGGFIQEDAQAIGLAKYEIWDDLTAWIFAVKDALCVLYSVFFVKSGKRPKSADEGFMGFNGGTLPGEEFPQFEQFEAVFPALREVPPFSRNPFYTSLPPDSTSFSTPIAPTEAAPLVQKTAPMPPKREQIELFFNRKSEDGESPVRRVWSIFEAWYETHAKNAGSLMTARGGGEGDGGDSKPTARTIATP